MVSFDVIGEGQYHISLSSNNGKTGGMVVTSAPRQTCPGDCPFWNNGCYGQNYGINFTWAAISQECHKNGLTFEEYVVKLRSLPKGRKVRGNQVGDLPGTGNNLNPERCIALAKAMGCNKKQAFTYSHKPLTPENIEVFKAMLAHNYTVNISCETVAKVKQAWANGLPAVLTVPEDNPDTMDLGDGVHAVTCPQQVWKAKKRLKADGTPLTCEDCMLCWIKSNKRPVIMFKAHGNQKKKLHNVLRVLNGGDFSPLFFQR